MEQGRDRTLEGRPQDTAVAETVSVSCPKRKKRREIDEDKSR